MKEIISVSVLAAALVAALWGAPSALAQEKPVASRFADNGNGTVTDKTTGLIWLKNANCANFFTGDKFNRNSRSWHDARVAVSRLASGFCGLSDNSSEGDWRLPTREELLGIAKQNATVNGKWTVPEVFVGLQSFFYWSSSIGDLYPDFAFYVGVTLSVDSYAFQMNAFNVLAVRREKKSR